jgi:hypothetical protein
MRTRRRARLIDRSSFVRRFSKGCDSVRRGRWKNLTRPQSGELSRCFARSGCILAALIRISGSFDLAEEAMQEALAVAVVVHVANVALR